jgi:hypothetical protein
MSQQKYEVRNILERFLLSMAMLSADRLIGRLAVISYEFDEVLGPRGVLGRDQEYRRILMKFKSELKGMIRFEQYIEYETYLISEIDQYFDVMRETTNVVSTNEVSQTININREEEFTYIKYGEIQIKYPTVRIDMLRKLGSVYYVALTALKYESILCGSQHWAIAPEAYEKLFQEGRANVECFASPFNSYLLGREGCAVYTLFKTDEQFGCRWNFLHQLTITTIDMMNKQIVMVCNPPFTELAMALGARQILKILDSYPGSAAYFYGPRWVDAEFNKVLVASKYYLTSIILPAREYNIATIRGEKIKMPIVSQIICVSSGGSIYVPTVIEIVDKNDDPPDRRKYARRS